MTGFVYLAGAGCGGADLASEAVHRVLGQCGAVVYDSLCAPELPEEAPPGAERICVGKRAGVPSPKQADINALLIRLAREGKTVVRLKGGDPLVFGRGGEEASALAAAEVPYALLPGISSALAVPLEAGIPVTYRGVSRSVHIVTAHTAESDLPEHLPLLAGLDGTLVFLMGLHSLDRLAAELIRLGKSAETPAAVLSGGNAPHPAEVRGTLEDIGARVCAAGVASPAVIVVGDTAAMDLRSPLMSGGVSAGLTGTDVFQEKMASFLARYGFQTYPLQRAQLRALETPIPWERLDGTWLVFTSGQGVREFFLRMEAEEQDIRRLSLSHFAVIGKSTGRVLREYGIRADLCPVEYTGEALAAALPAYMGAGDEAFLLDSAKGSGVVSIALNEQGIPCTRVSLYDTVYRTVRPSAQPRYLLFGSAGAVRAMHKSGYRLSRDTVPACIGPVCAEAMRNLYCREPLIPDTNTAEALAETVHQYAAQEVLAPV